MAEKELSARRQLAGVLGTQFFRVGGLASGELGCCWSSMKSECKTDAFYLAGSLYAKTSLLRVFFKVPQIFLHLSLSFLSRTTEGTFYLQTGDTD